MASIEVAKTADLGDVQTSTYDHPFYSEERHPERRLVYSEERARPSTSACSWAVQVAPRSQETLTKVDQSATLEEFRDLAAHALRNHAEARESQRGLPPALRGDSPAGASSQA